MAMNHCSTLRGNYTIAAPRSPRPLTTETKENSSVFMNTPFYNPNYTAL